MTDRYLVLGNPIEHSLSPTIHRLFAEQTGEEAEYDRLLVEADAFDDTVRQLQQDGIAGANVTVPFKEQAFRIADESSPRAAMAAAANTLVFRQGGSILADNTDGVGLVNDLMHNYELPLSGRNILIVGAGGAVRGVLKPLIDERPSSITLANRTREKAEQIRALFADQFNITVCEFAELEGQQFDIVINGTSLGLQGKVAPLPDNLFTPASLAYDMMYGQGSLPFQQWARSQGAEQALDGLGMLVGQAAESFYIWRGVRPDPLPVIDHLRSA